MVLEGRLTLGYLCRMNTCLVDSDVSLNPLGLLCINIHTTITETRTNIEYFLLKYFLLSFADPFPDVSALMDLLYISQSSAVLVQRPKLKKGSI